MPRGRDGIPRPELRYLSRSDLLQQLQQVDGNAASRDKVLRLETAFRRKIATHLDALPSHDAEFEEFNTSPYVLLIHARRRSYTKVSQLAADILPAKQFSSMETSAGRMVEEVVLPEYGWACVPSEMHSSNSAIDGKKIDAEFCHIATLKSGPRCLNDEMSENLADAVLGNFASWAREANRRSIEFSYGVLYGTPRQSNKKDWHILRNVKEKAARHLTVSPDGRWTCQFQQDGITVDLAVRIGLDWWVHLGGPLCFMEVFVALIRACVDPGPADPATFGYEIGGLGEIVSTRAVREGFNVSLLQQSQFPWLFLMARHFCDELRG